MAGLIFQPYCTICGEPVRPNVPRLGWGAGAVHVSNSGLDCPRPPMKESERIRKLIQTADISKEHWLESILASCSDRYAAGWLASVAYCEKEPTTDDERIDLRENILTAARLPYIWEDELIPAADRLIIVGPDIDSGNPDRLVCTVNAPGGKLLHAEVERVDSSAGLGGYDLAELEEAKRRLKNLCKVFIHGYKSAQESYES